MSWGVVLKETTLLVAAVGIAVASLTAVLALAAPRPRHERSFDERRLLVLAELAASHFESTCEWPEQFRSAEPPRGGAKTLHTVPPWWAERHPFEDPSYYAYEGVHDDGLYRLHARAAFHSDQPEHDRVIEVRGVQGEPCRATIGDPALWSATR